MTSKTDTCRLKVYKNHSIASINNRNYSIILCNSNVCHADRLFIESKHIYNGFKSVGSINWSLNLAGDSCKFSEECSTFTMDTRSAHWRLCGLHDTGFNTPSHHKIGWRLFSDVAPASSRFCRQFSSSSRLRDILCSSLNKLTVL